MSALNELEIVIDLDKKKIISIITIVAIVSVVSVTYIQALLAFNADSIDKPLHINSLATQNTDGDEVSSFARGSLVTFAVDIEHANTYSSYYTSFEDPTDYIIIVQVIKGSTPVYLGFGVGPLSPGDSDTLGTGYRIGDSDAQGTYTVEVYVWSAWDDSRVILADNSGYSTTFTVSG